jgi:peptidoglycan/LPS O-acetylase OafA/YrhL
MVDKTMKRRLAFLSRVLIIALVILALFLVYWLLIENDKSTETDTELTITVILFVSINFLIAFADKEVKDWERTLFLIGMFLGFLLFLSLSFLFYFDATIEMPGWIQAHQSIVNNEVVTSEWMLILAVILLDAIAVFILILRRESIGNRTKTL